MKSTAAFSLDQVSVPNFLNTIPCGIALLDTEFRIVEMNTMLEALTGYSTADARGVFADYILRSNLGNNGKIFRQVLSSGDPVSTSGDIINLNLKKIPIQFTVSPLPDNAGKHIALIVALEDVSALQSFERQRLGQGETDDILGHSPQMQEIFELLPILAHTDASVLITGETGTGKDLIAESIHKLSKRSNHTFIKINCGALPESLLESELFGHVRGAFTGAVRDKPGMFYLADKGTIFLTEIGDLPLSLQVKLLSVLDDREFFPVGGTKKIKVDVRVIAATHQPLKELVAIEKFRKDLFYRLNVLRLHLPSLRDREGDIRLLMDHFLRIFNANLKKNIKSFDPGFIEAMIAYDYPGNVRELRNIIEYSVNVCQDGRIRLEHLPKYLQEPRVRHHVNNLRNQKAPFEQEIQQSTGSETLSSAGGGSWADVEKERILDALKKANGNRSRAAKILGWGRTTLWRKLNRYNMN